MDLFNDLRRFVPNIPDLLVDNCIKTTESIREQAITNNRATILIMQMNSNIYRQLVWLVICGSYMLLVLIVKIYDVI